MPKNNSKPNRERRVQDAIDRGEKRARLSSREQALILDTRPGESKKERARLGDAE